MLLRISSTFAGPRVDFDAASWVKRSADVAGIVGPLAKEGGDIGVCDNDPALIGVNDGESPEVASGENME